VSRRPDPRVGVFDTLLVQAGAPVALEAHVGRLVASVHALYGVSLDAADLAQEVSRIVAATGVDLQRVRVDFVPGTGVTVVARPLDARPRGPWHLVVRRVPGGWGAHKWRDRSLLEGWADAEDPSTDPLLVDEQDRLLESGRGNVFLVTDGEVATPPLDGRILPGVTRDEVLRLLEALGVGVRSRPVTLAGLAGAAEVFVTGSIGGVRPVATCDAAGPWPTGPVTRTVAAALERTWSRTP
jgi:para-aminobenzoate synthetase/4-amino-4-deoxychorismate lyase